ncbi:MAG: PASTA domain-containing protein [Clostridia bacterium]|nr:PASTA domain-containing protein [Clostridia bacterium]
MGLFVVLFLMLAARLFVLQIIRSEELQRRAQAQWTSEAVIIPQRGDILDRNGYPLAMSASAYIASVSPRQVEDAELFAKILAPVLNMDEDVLLSRASDISKGGVVLKRQITRDVAQQLRTMYSEYKSIGSGALNGLYLEEDSKRFYPMGAFATQLLGLTTIDGVGQSGLEASLNKYLSGETGEILSEIDGRGRSLAYGKQEYIPAADGNTVELTIDYVIQSFAEQAAREAIEVNAALGIRIIVMDPKTGEILAMCTKPDFDPNDPPRGDVSRLTELMRNRIVTDSYEPGSTFKILTTAAAIDAGVTNTGEGFYCSGSVSVDGSRIRCWGNPHGAETMAEALCNSCNPVFVELGLRLGTERLYGYLENFGLGSKTGVDISGEAAGIMIAESKVKRVDLARIGFGQSVAVTPIQLITACCAAVNGGNLMKPYVVKRIVSHDGSVIEENAPMIAAQPISSSTSATMRMLLEKVVSEGGGRNAYIEGYRIGGKTGTAQVYKNGVVSSETHIGSFIGFAPIDDPKIAVLVIVDEASKGSDFGSVTAAPFARDILEKSLSYLGVVKESERIEAARHKEVPDVCGMPLKEARQALKDAGFKCLLENSGTMIIDQMPKAGAAALENSVVMLYADGVVESENNYYVEVPDVSGMSVSAANRMIVSEGLNMRISGSGVAVSQSPTAGELVQPTATVTVIFETPSEPMTIDD